MLDKVTKQMIFLVACIETGTKKQNHVKTDICFEVGELKKLLSLIPSLSGS